MDAIDELLEECGNFDKAMADLRDAAAIKVVELRKEAGDGIRFAEGMFLQATQLRQELADTKHDFQDAQNCSRALMDEKVALLAKVAKAKRLLSQQALEYAFYGMQPPKDLLSWLEENK